MQVYARARGQHQPAEIAADFAIHLLGTVSGVVGAVVLVALAGTGADQKILWSALAYSIALIMMLGFSAAYHLRRLSERRELLRRLDHAAIFVMIAGTYTPFSVCVFDGALAVWATIAIWIAAVAGATAKLIYPRRLERVSIVVYLALGWSVLVVSPSLFKSVDRTTSILIVVGGALYSIGVGIHRWRRLPFHDSIWHCLVLIAASCHYVAILHGIVLTGSRS